MDIVGSQLMVDHIKMADQKLVNYRFCIFCKLSFQNISLCLETAAFFGMISNLIF